MTVQLMYFAWVRERIGKSSEAVELPPSVTTVADLIAWLSTRGPEYAHAFAQPALIRAALDKTHVKAAAPVSGAREIAFFPPVTGG